MSWSGSKFHCIKCGFPIIEEDSPEQELNEYDFDSDEDYEKYKISDARKNTIIYYDKFEESNTYHCSNVDCECKAANSIVLFHPLRGVGSSAGDSLAFGIDYLIENNCYCFMCGSTINTIIMRCTNNKCCYNFNHCLDFVYNSKIKTGLAYIK